MNTLTVDALIVNEYRHLRAEAPDADLYLPTVLSESEKEGLRESVNEHLAKFPDTSWAVSSAVEDYEERQFDQWIGRLRG
jgi:hypothetical protein